MKDPVFGWLGFWFWRLVNLSVLSAAFSFICYFGVMFIWFDQFDVEHFLKAAENIFDYREKDILGAFYVWGSVCIGVQFSVIVGLVIALVFRFKEDIYRRGGQLEDYRGKGL